MTGSFVPASRLYDVESRTPIAYPAQQATDADVRVAIGGVDDHEIRTDGGHSSNGIDRPRAFPELETRLNLLLGHYVVDEQHHPFARRKIVDEQPELVAARERPDAWSGCISIGTFADEFDRPSIVSTEFELTHAEGYHGIEYGCIRFERRSVLSRSLRTDTEQGVDRDVFDHRLTEFAERFRVVNLVNDADFHELNALL